MVNDTQTAKSISLEQYGIKNAKVNYQLSPSNLHDITISKGQGVEASSGALALNTGEFPGRSPLDRCKNDTCGGLFAKHDRRMRYCSTTCADAQRQREGRRRKRLEKRHA